ncbi:uncharacterized protein LOC112510516 [Cynara cardunculus var. scolymus]|uniref:Sterile alpha motif domain-containing protein n=1 Tax=Cynara cardunculus var. scolymus TaxID=59895 RepID=A0A118K3U2_CYNCS|nr:uncharacterized protein LOC112510516 [Cynara cardunculus var. scolymus]KVI06468.1 Sterile alpha motif domain-containing protein [Cynara cardunculus var. scolymus]
MLVSHMESKGQRWPNVRLGEIGDVSAAFNYGISDMMMNNLWLYDFNILEEPQNDQIAVFPEQPSSEFTVSDPDLSLKFVVDTQHNRENDDPNSMKAPSGYGTNNEMEMSEPKTTQKCIKGPRSKRCKRTVFEGPWKFKALSADLYGSTDNQGSAMSKRTFGNDVNEPTFKIQKGGNFENNDLISESSGRYNDVGVNSVGRWLEDVGFGRYAGVFEMHEVDEEVLPLLTFDDLKEMGVLAVGPRRKLYAAICGLKARCNN